MMMVVVVVVRLLYLPGCVQGQPGVTTCLDPDHRYLGPSTSRATQL